MPRNPLAWDDDATQTDDDALWRWLATQQGRGGQGSQFGNALLMPVASRSDAAGAAPPGPLNQQGEWSFGSFNRIPNYNPPGTYTGALPTPDPASGQQQFPTGEAHAAYGRAVQLLLQQGVPPAHIDRLLQTIYMRGRT